MYWNMCGRSCVRAMFIFINQTARRLCGRALDIRSRRRGSIPPIAVSRHMQFRQQLLVYLLL